MVIKTKAEYTYDYHMKLAREYATATGKTELTPIEDIIQWHKERLYILEKFSYFLVCLNLKENILNTFAEVGKIGLYNTVSYIIGPTIVISPYTFMIKAEERKKSKVIYYNGILEEGIPDNSDTSKDNNPCYNGILQYYKSSFKISKTTNDKTVVPNTSTFDTFLIHNPDFNIAENPTLHALQFQVWEKPNIIIGIYGHKDDKDRKKKIEDLEKCKQQILKIGERFYLKGWDFILKEVEELFDDGTYVKLLMPEQSGKEEYMMAQKSNMYEIQKARFQ
jgi:hypothetical protein